MVIVAPFPGAPLDPPFRSRFQVRYIDPLASARTLAVPHLKQGNAATVELVDNLGKAITALQVMKEMSEFITQQFDRSRWILMRIGE